MLQNILKTAFICFLSLSFSSLFAQDEPINLTDMHQRIQELEKKLAENGDETVAEIEIDEGWKMSIGFTLSPSFIYTLEDDAPTQLGAPLLATFSLAKEKWFIGAYYSLASNEPSILVNYSLNPKLGVYYLGSINPKIDLKYSSIGLTTPLGNALGFIEVGRNFGSEASSTKPYLVGGVLIFFMKDLN